MQTHSHTDQEYFVCGLGWYLGNVLPIQHVPALARHHAMLCSQECWHAGAASRVHELQVGLMADRVPAQLQRLLMPFHISVPLQKPAAHQAPVWPLLFSPGGIWQI